MLVLKWFSNTLQADGSFRLSENYVNWPESGAAFGSVRDWCAVCMTAGDTPKNKFSSARRFARI